MRLRVPMTYEIAHAASWDAANANMRKAGRVHWNEDDVSVFVDTFNRLWTVEDEIAASRAAFERFAAREGNP